MDSSAKVNVCAKIIQLVILRLAIAVVCLDSMESFARKVSIGQITRLANKYIHGFIIVFYRCIQCEN